MPDDYTKILERVIAMRFDVAAADSGVRVDRMMVDSSRLLKSLEAETGIPIKTCTAILRTLHDLGDVLWLDDIGVDLFKELIVLDPLLMIDFVRQVVSHKHSSEVVSHTQLLVSPFWSHLDGEDQLLGMKQLLQAFQLAHPANSELTWQSDLIVPSLWEAKASAAWLFGYEDLRLGKHVSRTFDEAVRVRWEYLFMNGFPTTLFDHLVVASYSPYHDRSAGPDWILYEDGEKWVCRAMVARDRKTDKRTLRLEAVQNKTADEDQADELWEVFELVSGGLLGVLCRYPGLVWSTSA